jgi:hypothetical protein
MHVRSLLASAVLISTSILACRREEADDDDEQASATTTSALQAQSEAGLTDGVVEIEGTLAPSAEEAARIVSARPARGLSPEGCATTTRSGNVVTLTLDGCTGPFGRVVVRGALIATFSKTASNVLRVEVVTTEGTTANDKPLRYRAEADVRFEGSQRFLTYHGQSSGTTYRGRPFERETNLTIDADVATECAAIDGVSKGTVGRYRIDVLVDGLRGCRGSCPTAGLARATLSGPFIPHASVQVTFDGSDEAMVTIEARRRRELTVRLDCAAAEAD